PRAHGNDGHLVSAVVDAASGGVMPAYHHRRSHRSSLLRHAIDSIRNLRVVTCAIAVSLGVLLMPTQAAAQATMSGTVHDSSGAVLPGVAVTVASPALIEKTRTTVTDNTGQYRLTELRPGKYVLTFMLNGFSTVKQENVDVSGASVITINADMRVGGLQ